MVIIVTISFTALTFDISSWPPTMEPAPGDVGRTIDAAPEFAVSTNWFSPIADRPAGFVNVAIPIVATSCLVVLARR